MRYILKREKGVAPLVLLFIFAVLLTIGYFTYRYVTKPAPMPSPVISPALKYDPKVITVAVDSRPASMLFYALNHFIPKNRFVIKPIIIENPDERWTRMAAGDIDLAFSTLPEYVLGAARHNPGSLICYISLSKGCDGLLVRKDIKDISDLVDKKVSTVPGSGDHYFLIQVLDSKGKSTAEIRFIPAANTEDALQNFIRGNYVDCAVLSEPYLFKGKNSGKILVTTGDKFTITEILVASWNSQEQRPEDIQIVINAYFQLVELIKKNPGLAKKLIITRSERPIEEVEFIFTCLKLFDMEEAKAISRDAIIKSMEKIQQIWSIEGLPNADRRIDFTRALNHGFMERASIDNSASLFEEPESPTPMATDEIITPAISATPEISPSGATTSPSSTTNATPSGLTPDAE